MITLPTTYPITYTLPSGFDFSFVHFKAILNALAAAYSATPDNTPEEHICELAFDLRELLRAYPDIIAPADKP